MVVGGVVWNSEGSSLVSHSLSGPGSNAIPSAWAELHFSHSFIHKSFIDYILLTNTVPGLGIHKLVNTWPVFWRLSVKWGKKSFSHKATY